MSRPTEPLTTCRRSRDDDTSQRWDTCPTSPVRVVGRGTSYPRGGGESGTEDESRGAGRNAGSEAAPFAGPRTAAAGASTAGGPISDAAIAAIGSDVLRQEQESESGVDFDADREWCIGHICPSPWSQVH